MPRENVYLDPTTEAATNAQLALDDEANGIVLLRQEYETDQEYTGAESADTEGSVRVQSRPKDTVVTVAVRCSGANMRTRVKELQRKIAKLDAHEGTLKRVLSDSTYCVWDVKAASIKVPANWEFLHRTSVEVTMRFVCDPYWRGAPVTLSAHNETTLPCLIFTETGITGDELALGKLVVTDAQGADQWHVEYGVQVENYPGTATADTTAALFYEAETRLTYGGAAGSAISGASGGTIVAGTVTTNYQALLSTASSGTVHCTHVGDYRVKARVYCPFGGVDAGTVSYALQWGVGDLRSSTINDAAIYDTLDEFREVDLGLIHIPEVAQGAQLWEGRVLAKTTISGGLAGVDCLYLLPTAEAYGEAQARAFGGEPTAFTIHDAFDQTAGTVTGKTSSSGHTWALLTGDTDDYTIDTTNDCATRNTTSDTAGRLERLGSSTLGGSSTTWAAQVDLKASEFNAGLNMGMGVRAESSLLNGVVYIVPDSSTSAVLWVSGYNAPDRESFSAPVSWAAAQWYTLRIVIDGSLRFFVWFHPKNSARGEPVLTGLADSAIWGAADCGYGLYDYNSSATATVRSYDNFWAAPVVADAAVFASQSLEVRHDRAIREDSAGSFWQPVSSYEGDYLRIPPASNEARSARFIVKALRHPPDTMADAAIDDLSATLTYTPRGRQVPEP